MNDVQAQANRKYSARRQAHVAVEQCGRVARAEEEKEQARLNKAVQFRTRLSLIERRLFSVRAILRHQPQDAAARAEAEQLEALYKTLLDGNAA